MTDSADRPTINTEGGAAFTGPVTVDRGSTFIGRDQIINTIQQIVRTAAEEAEQAHNLEAKYLAQGVSAFAQRLRDRAAATDDSLNPYKGLLEYRLSDAEIFFGRERDIQALMPRLLSASLTVLHSESGAGKTSLLQAGLSPQLIAADQLPLFCRPYDVSPALKIKQTLLPDLAQVPQLAAAPLREFLLQVSRVVGSRTTLVILLDQFEEFFTRAAEPSRPAFINELADCLEDDSLNVRWVLALRSEFFSNLALFRPRIRNPFENDYRLNRLSRADAATVIARPAERFGVAFEAGLIDRLLDDLGQDEFSPPHIQLICSALYSERGEATLITQALYDREGGAAGILRGHLERVLNRDVPADQRLAARRVLEALISSEPRRVQRSRTALIEELAAWGIAPATTESVVAQLIESRLVRSLGEEQAASYELVHDYLLGEIKLDPAVQARKAAQELLDREVQSYQRYGTLLSDDKLAILRPHRKDLVLTISARRLFTESERVTRKRRTRRKRALVGALVVLSVLSVLTMPLVIRPVDTDWRFMPSPVAEYQSAISRLAVDVTNPDILFASSGQAHDLWRSTDGGQKWESLGASLPDTSSIQGIVVSDQLLYLVTANRVWTSHARRIAWHLAQFESPQVIEAVAVNPLNAQRAYLGTHNASLYATSDGGQTWNHLSQIAGLENAPTALATNGKTLIVADDHRVLSSDDEGTTWRFLTASDIITDRISGLAAVGQRGRFFVAASASGLYDAEVNSVTWERFDLVGASYAVASGDNAFYSSRGQDLLCRRIWIWPNDGWWQWNLGRNAPCQGSLAR